MIDTDGKSNAHTQLSVTLYKYMWFGMSIHCNQFYLILNMCLNATECKHA